jgi:ribosomal protein RSM22 (predicted rRNA methylase)
LVAILWWKILDNRRIANQIVRCRPTLIETMQSARIPQALREQIEEQAAAFSGAALAEASARMSESYRAGVAPRLDSALSRAAYLVTRMPATYGALKTAAAELGFEPESWLDLGAGPGTAAWVAQCPATLVDANAGWVDLREARRVCSDLTRLPHLEPHDVVSVCYALNELAEKERSRVVDEAWALARRAVLVLEPGTMEGFRIVREARRQLLGLGARIQAPCPREGECPMEEGDWCHFAVRVERSRLHRQLKGGELSYEDEKYSFVLAIKGDAQPGAGRILRHPRVHPGLIELRVCGPEGIREEKVTKRCKEAWRAARKADWGARWEGAR